MPAPQVFISSTYYDLKHIRRELKNFIESLGYTAILHERGDVAYTQTITLEESCYNEIPNCNIFISIIGSRYGTQATNNEDSISMNELKTALKDRKKIFIFIVKEVYVENDTYLKNKDSQNFSPYHAENIKIHEFISSIKKEIKNNYIGAFSSTDEIISLLKTQFASLFQNLLLKEATLTESQTLNDFQQTADKIKNTVEDLASFKDEFTVKINSSILRQNVIINEIRRLLGMSKSYFFANDLQGFEEFLKIVGYFKNEKKEDESIFYFIQEGDGINRVLKVNKKSFNEKGCLINEVLQKNISEYVSLETIQLKELTVDTEDLPF